MPGASSKTTLVTLRLPNDVVEIIQRRVGGTGYPPGTVRSYLEKRVIFDVRRKHKKREE